MASQISFSEREREVIGLLLQGKSNKQIALTLHVARRTVEFHLSNIYAKLGAASRTDAVLKLSENDLWKTTGPDQTDGLRKSVIEKGDEPDENDGNPISFRRRSMNKKAYIVVLCLLGFLVLVASVIIGNLISRRMPSGLVPTQPGYLSPSGVPSNVPTVAAVQPSQTSEEMLSMPPTPENTFESRSFQDGPFDFDLRLYLDPGFRKDPDMPWQYSDVQGLGLYVAWVYSQPNLTFTSAVEEHGMCFSDVTSTDGVDLQAQRFGVWEGGINFPPNTEMGDRLQFNYKINTPDGSYGGFICFTVQDEGGKGVTLKDVLIAPLSQLRRNCDCTR